MTAPTLDHCEAIFSRGLPLHLVLDAGLDIAPVHPISGLESCATRSPRYLFCGRPLFWPEYTAIRAYPSVTDRRAARRFDGTRGKQAAASLVMCPVNFDSRWASESATRLRDQQSDQWPGCAGPYLLCSFVQGPYPRCRSAQYLPLQIVAQPQCTHRAVVVVQDIMYLVVGYV